MRVIGGSAKGMRLGSVPPGVRPLSDRAREGLFSSLGETVRDARVLDLYAGTGAMGIEALSRGAAAATFVDSSTGAADAIRGNLQRCHLETEASVVVADVSAFLGRNDKLGGAFDLVLCDPPYDLGPPEVDDMLQELASGWLAEGPWTVVLTRGRRSSTPVIPLHWTVSRQLAYGDSLVIVFREVRWA